jgi:hypothetical protein
MNMGWRKVREESSAFARMLANVRDDAKVIFIEIIGVI